MRKRNAYIYKRLIQLIPIVLGLTFLSFALLYLSPGDAAHKKLTAQGVAVTEDVIERTREEMGLNRPLIVQYADWLLHLAQGDWGTSYKDNLPVASKLGKAAGYTFVLALSSLLLSLALSLPLGVYGAVRKNSLPDWVLRFLCFGGNAMPNFLLAILLTYVFSIRFKLFPVIAKGSLQGLLLPVLSLSLPLTASFIRQIRAAVLTQLGEPYVTGARARGVREFYVLFCNVLPGALPSIITVAGLAVGTLLGGSVVVENIFMWPGLGKLAMDSITARDYPVIQGYVVLMAFVYVLINLAADISYRYLDPRIGREQEL